MRLPTSKDFEEYAALSSAARREVNKDPRSFLLFFSYYFFEYVKYPFAPFHLDFAKDLVDLHTQKITSLVWCTSRDTAKTAFARAWLIWNIVNAASMYPNVDSHDRVNSERFLYEVIHALQTNKRLIVDYGQLFNDPVSRTEEKQQKRTANFVTTNNVRCEAHTTQESVRGRTHGEMRPTMVINDDFETLKVVRSEASIKEVEEHLSEFRGGLEQKGSYIIYLCNYLSETANVAALRNNARLDPKCRFRVVPRVWDSAHASCWPDSPVTGQPSWPQRDVLTDAELEKSPGKISIETKRREMRKEDSGDTDWLREMQLLPVDPSTAKFRKEMFLPVSRDEVDKMETAAYLLIDPPGTAHDEASRARGEGDFVGFALVKVTTSGKWMVEGWRARVGPREMIATMFALWNAENLVAVGIEDTQFWQGMKLLVEDEEMKRGLRLDIRELKHTAKRSKADRILALLPRYESKSVWHIVGRCNDLEQELLRFPVSDHDDACDALAMANEIAERPQGRIAQQIMPKSTTVYRYNKNRLGRSGC